jgi:hypothetical protein
MLKMKWLLASLVIVLLGLGVTACGVANKGVGSTSQTPSTAGAPGGAVTTIALEIPNFHEDKGDDREIYVYGHAASAADRQVVTAVVKRYYAAVAAGNGAAACSLLHARFAKAIPEEYGRASGPPYLRGKTCRAIVSLVSKYYRSELTAAIEVTGVRVKGNYALALLRSNTLPFVYTRLEREGAAWRIYALLGGVLP